MSRRKPRNRSGHQRGCAAVLCLYSMAPPGRSLLKMFTKTDVLKHPTTACPELYKTNSKCQTSS